MEGFWKELGDGEIQFRDRFQFELKSDFSPLHNGKASSYHQEFYLFLPNALQISKRNYTPVQFYRDQTNFIRYKTPVFTFRELINLANARSPLSRIRSILDASDSNSTKSELIDEIKLFGNIVRSALRTRIAALVEKLPPKNPDKTKEFGREIQLFCKELQTLRNVHWKIQDEVLNNPKLPSELKQYYLYIDEFISNSIEFFLVGLLDQARNAKLDSSIIKIVDKLLCERIKKEEAYRHTKFKVEHTEADSTQKEYVIYRKSLLNKFALDALLLSIKREAVVDRYRNVIGAIAAGLAMLVYLLLFIWQGGIFVINSFPFIIITVFLYIIKDRMKEGLKLFYSKQAIRWFPDYSTRILNPNEDRSIGEINESFNYLNPNKLPSDIIKVRNREFHTELDRFERPETVLCYKKQVKIHSKDYHPNARRFELNTIFRLNIHRFLEKASEPYTSHLQLNTETGVLAYTRLPKVYHLNIIQRNTYTDANGKLVSYLKKFRLIVDKDGIKRVERVGREQKSKVTPESP